MVLYFILLLYSTLLDALLHYFYFYFTTTKAIPIWIGTKYLKGCIFRY